MRVEDIKVGYTIKYVYTSPNMAGNKEKESVVSYVDETKIIFCEGKTGVLKKMINRRNILRILSVNNEELET